MLTISLRLALQRLCHDRFERPGVKSGTFSSAQAPLHRYRVAIRFNGYRVACHRKARFYPVELSNGQIQNIIAYNH